VLIEVKNENQKVHRVSVSYWCTYISGCTHTNGTQDRQHASRLRDWWKTSSPLSRQKDLGRPSAGGPALGLLQY